VVVKDFEDLDFNSHALEAAFQNCKSVLKEIPDEIHAKQEKLDNYEVFIEEILYSYIDYSTRVSEIANEDSEDE
jgi:hypothetical protein